MNEKVILGAITAIVLVIGTAAVIGIYSPTPVHAAKPCYYHGNPHQPTCFPSLQQCLKASPGNSPCKRQ